MYSTFVSGFSQGQPHLEAQHAAVVRRQAERTYWLWRLLLAGGVQLAELGQA